MKAVSILVFTAICGFVSSQISRLEDFGSQKDAGNFRFDSDSKGMLDIDRLSTLRFMPYRRKKTNLSMFFIVMHKKPN